MDEARARYIALKRRHRPAKDRSAVERGATLEGGFGHSSRSRAAPFDDRKAADSGRQRSGSRLGATLADVWPGVRP